MWNRFYDNEFEEYLKNQANQHRIYPTDKVWRNIQRNVHGYRKWPALTVIAVFIIAALMVGTITLRPHTEVTALTKATISEEITGTQQQNSIEVSSPTKSKNYTEHLLAENFTQQTIARVTEQIINDEAESVLIASSYSHADEQIITEPPIKISENPIAIVQPQVQIPIVEAVEIANFDAAMHSATLPDSRFIFSTNFNLGSSYDANHFSNALYNEELPFLRNDNSYMPSLEIASASPVVTSPLSKIGRGSSKLDFQFYLTPSYSYRRLVDDVQGSLTKSYVAAIPFQANYVIDLSRAIQHRPSVGYEVGFSLGYNLNKKFAIRSGFQFNVRQYNIDAYVHSAEPTTVALSSDNSNLVFNTVSSFRSIEGSRPIELKNRYYEIAMPIGIDWRPISGKFAWGIAASVQPTYTFDKEPFIITSNYKNYADGSQLMRNWNINANFETYVGYNTGKYRWQLGPQFRYQVMSTMGNAFPIREYPFDIGIKLGLTRSLK